MNISLKHTKSLKKIIKNPKGLKVVTSTIQYISKKNLSRIDPLFEVTIY